MGARDQRWPASSHRSRWPRLAMGLVQCPRNQLTRGRRAGRGGPSAEPWLLRVAGGEGLTLVAPYECPERAATQRVPRRGPPAPPGALSTTFWDRTLAVIIHEHDRETARLTRDLLVNNVDQEDRRGPRRPLQAFPQGHTGSRRPSRRANGG